MSSLSEKLEYISNPPAKRPASFISWFSALTANEQDDVWRTLNNTNVKNYTLFGVLREAGLKMSKDNFIALRKDVLAGETKRADINE